MTTNTKGFQVKEKCIFFKDLSLSSGAPKAPVFTSASGKVGAVRQCLCLSVSLLYKGYPVESDRMVAVKESLLWLLHHPGACGATCPLWIMPVRIVIVCNSNMCLRRCRNMSAHVNEYLYILGNILHACVSVCLCGCAQREQVALLVCNV